MNVKIYQCFRTGASRSIHNICGSREFLSGGGGGWVEVPGPTARNETALTTLDVFFFVFFFRLVLNLFCSLQRWSNGCISEGVQLFPRGGSNFFKAGGGGGPNANFYRDPYNL